MIGRRVPPRFKTSEPGRERTEENRGKRAKGCARDTKAKSCAWKLRLLTQYAALPSNEYALTVLTKMMMNTMCLAHYSTRVPLHVTTYPHPHLNYSLLGENPAVSIDIPAASILRSATQTSSNAFPNSYFFTRKPDAIAWNECVSRARSYCIFASCQGVSGGQRGKRDGAYSSFPVSGEACGVAVSEAAVAVVGEDDTHRFEFQYHIRARRTVPEPRLGGRWVLFPHLCRTDVRRRMAEVGRLGMRRSNAWCWWNGRGGCA